MKSSPALGTRSSGQSPTTRAEVQACSRRVLTKFLAESPQLQNEEVKWHAWYTEGPEVHGPSPVTLGEMLPCSYIYDLKANDL